MSKRYARTTRVEADVVVWDGKNSLELAELLGKPITAQPAGNATWPDEEEGVGTVEMGQAVVKWADGPSPDDAGRVEIVDAKEFAESFSQVRPRAPKAETATSTSPSPAAATAAGKSAQAADA